ncbi:MAG: redoxin family protein [Alphaproteobacteria bacterium]|nr:redoxin family protein [Alphaproteobacteria bacterium]
MAPRAAWLPLWPINRRWVWLCSLTRCSRTSLRVALPDLSLRANQVRCVTGVTVPGNRKLLTRAALYVIASFLPAFVAATLPFVSHAFAAAGPPPVYSERSQFIFIEPRTVPRPTPILTPSGKTVSLARFSGRVVLLNFWATWCAPCRQELPALDRLQATLGRRGLEVVAVSIDRDGLSAVAPFFRQHGLRNLSIYLDPQHRTGYLNATNPSHGEFAIYALPITYLINRQGRIVGYFPGPFDWGSPAMHRFLEYYLDQPK